MAIIAMTITEKILATHAGLEKIEAGDLIPDEKRNWQ